LETCGSVPIRTTGAAASKTNLLEYLLIPDEELALPGLRLELVQGPGEESHGEQGVIVILVDQLR
jgi:hypothetical protein